MRIRLAPQIQSIAQFVFGFLLLFLALSEPFQVNASEPPPSTQVEQFHDVLLSVMKDADQLGILGRYKKLEPVLSQVFSLTDPQRLHQVLFASVPRENPINICLFAPYYCHLRNAV